MRVSIHSPKSKNVFGHSAHLIAVFRITVNFIHLAGVERVKLPSSGLESLILITVLYPYFYLNNFILSIIFSFIPGSDIPKSKGVLKNLSSILGGNNFSKSKSSKIIKSLMLFSFMK